MIDIDVETTGVQWYAHELFLVTLKGDKAGPVCYRHPKDHDLIQMWLDRDDAFRAWNTKFDMHFLEAAGYRLPATDRWHDGMVQAHVIDANRSLALKAIAEKVYGPQERELEKGVKNWLNNEAALRRKAAKEGGPPFVAPSYRDVPDHLMLPYAKQDVKLTRDLCDGSFTPILTGDFELYGVYELERGVLGALYRVEKRGIPVDRAAAARFETELAVSLDGIEAKAVALAGKPNFNPSSSAQVQEALERRGADLRFCTKTKTGLSMDAESLATIDDELAGVILEFRSEAKLLGTYVRPMLHESWDSGLRCTKAAFITPGGRIHPNYRQVGARTGRMSASDPNIQNWPRDDLRLRYLLRAEPGHKLVTADLDSIELVLFGLYAGGGIKDAIINGVDIHTLTAQSVGLGDRRRSTGVESARQRGKTFNYAMIYGAGVRSLRKTFGVSQDEARAMIRRFQTTYPEVAVLQSDIEWKLSKRGYIKTAWGRHQRLDARDAYRAVNYLIQGTAADILKVALVELDELEVEVVALVHDEIVAHVPEAEAEEAGSLIVACLTDHPRITKHIPLKAEAKIVDRWSDAKHIGFSPSFA